jgi:hypothetical protein
MYVLVSLALIPLGLLAVVGMSWVEDHLLPPRGTGPAPPGLAGPAPGEADVRTWQPPERNH